MKIRMSAIPALLAVTLPVSVGMARGEEFFEERPIEYSATKSQDPVAKLAKDWERGENLIAEPTPLGFLRAFLKKLGVPEESQVLVFSKTSHQNARISPQTPRALYFSDDTYVGYVHGGDIEVIACDPRLGPVFYVVALPRPGRPAFAERDSSCLSCHATANTEGVPGMLVRSLVPDANGRPLLSLGTHLTTQASPLAERWGGWYVTGTHEGVLHMGNVTAADEENAALDMEAGANWKSLEGKIDTSLYLRPTSDIVALMVLEHQCRMHNLLIKASMEYQRALWVTRVVRPNLNEAETDHVAHRVAESSAQAIVREMLFCNEAEPGPFGVEGNPAFQKAFCEGAPADARGRTLRDFRLSGRMFTHRCSYMIHSKTFAALPDKVRGLVYAGLRKVFLENGGGEDFEHIGASERQRITAILDATHAEWRKLL